MLIGIDASRAVLPQRTGTENYALYLTRALLEMGSAHHFRLYFNQAPPVGLFIPSDRIELCIMPWPRLWTHIRLGWETARHPPDVLFVPSHVLPALYRGRSVVTVHDLGYIYYPEAHTAFQRWYLGWSTRSNARRAYIVIADSEATSLDLQRVYGIPKDKVSVAYPAGSSVTMVTDNAVLAECRRRYHTGQRYVLYVGSLQPRKNLPGLIRAFGLAAREYDLAADIRLVLAGKQGWLPEDLAGIAQAEGVGERLVLPGYIPEADLAALLSGALAYVLPSYYEGFGLPVLEAMSCGTPVICSNVSSLPEVAGDAALLVDPNDAASIAEALANISCDARLRLSLRERGLRRAAGFTWRNCAEQVLAALEAAGGIRNG
ncbi:MAG: glycosyltransferase family 4 protein [Chloroflexi bacterium]|nr:glycosyltransferase family 4 protein [Chloroflexota bacterium]